MITIKNVNKYFNSKFQRNYILKNIDLEVSEGEFISIMGPSGAGKSTLLNIIGLIDEPTEGEYYFLGQPVQKLKDSQKSEYHRNHIGFIFQAYHLIEELNVYENIESPLVYKGIKGKERQAIVADLLDRFNIVAKKDLFPQQLSGGQQQLVGIARAIAGKPRLLLADEPTGNLDPETSEGIFRLLQDISKTGRAVIVATHNYTLLKKFNARTVKCDEGKTFEISDDQEIELFE